MDDRHDAYRLALTDAQRGADGPVEAQAVAARVIGNHLGASRVMYGDLDVSAIAAEPQDHAVERVHRSDVPEVRLAHIDPDAVRDFLEVEPHAVCKRLTRSRGLVL